MRFSRFLQRDFSNRSQLLISKFFRFYLDIRYKGRLSFVIKQYLRKLIIKLPMQTSLLMYTLSVASFDNLPCIYAILIWVSKEANDRSTYLGSCSFVDISNLPVLCENEPSCCDGVHLCQTSGKTLTTSICH